MERRGGKCTKSQCSVAWCKRSTATAGPAAGSTTAPHKGWRIKISAKFMVSSSSPTRFLKTPTSTPKGSRNSGFLERRNIRPHPRTPIDGLINSNGTTNYLLSIAKADEAPVAPPDAAEMPGRTICLWPVSEVGRPRPRREEQGRINKTTKQPTPSDNRKAGG